MTETKPAQQAEQPLAFRVLTTVLAVALPLGAIIWATNVLRLVGLLFYPEQFGAVMLGLGLALVYLITPAGQGRHRAGMPPWYDMLAAALGLALCLYVAWAFPTLSISSAKTPAGLVASGALVALLLEGARRTAGLPIMLVGVVFLGLGLTAWMLPGDLAGRRVTLESLTWYMTWNTNSLLGLPTMIAVTVGVTFVLFGQALFLSGGSEFFTDISMALMGRFRGGQAKIAIVASALFGTISGSAVVNIISTGVVTIPMMKKAGYRPQVAAAVETVASTGGQLMPPVMGVAAFLIAEFLQVPYSEIALAALIPSVIFFAALFIQVDLEAGRFRIAPLPREALPKVGTVLRKGFLIPLPFVVLVVGMFRLNVPLDLVALYATLSIVVVGVFVGYAGKRLTPAALLEVLRSTGTTVLDLVMIVPIAGIVIGVLNVTGLSFTLALSLVEAAGGIPLVLLALTAVVSIFLGMGMPTVGVYILLATLVAPALVQMGFDPLASHLFIFYFGMLSMITPPVAIGAFAAATIARSNPMHTGFSAVRFGWSAFVIPFLFIFSPSLLFRAGPLVTIIDIATALSAVWLVAAGFTGFSLRHIPAGKRILYVVAGAGMILPLRLFDHAYLFVIGGATLGAALLAHDVISRRRGIGVMPLAEGAAIAPSE
ncbi:MAG: TRAP transporter fused permease subunit [Rhodobacteraceae bacterium]|nr:TRAP transporter fused permease subunit [Paracoccaceae bacterium]MBR9821019.1 TRAP transporter fused permease subunit [Paracoccaceae bacterium]